MRHTVHLTSIDPVRNRRRWYWMQIQVDLFGGVVLMCRWGRIGQGGRVRSIPCATEEDAHALMMRIARLRLSRGYVEVPGVTSMVTLSS